MTTSEAAGPENTPWQVSILQDGMYPEPLEPVEVFKPYVQKTLDLIDRVMDAHDAQEDTWIDLDTEEANRVYQWAEVPLPDMEGLISLLKVVQNADPDVHNNPDGGLSFHHVYAKAAVMLEESGLNGGLLRQDGIANINILRDGRVMAEYIGQPARILDDSEAQQILGFVNGITEMHLAHG